MRTAYLFVLFIFIIIMASFVSAGLLNNLYSKLTGKATSQPTNVTVGVAGVNPVQIFVHNETLVPPVTNIVVNGPRVIEFFVTVKDPDGVNDINKSSVTSKFTKVGEATRANSSCLYISDIDSTSANYTCTITMWYFDAPATWKINVSARDFGNTTIEYNDTQVFQYTDTTAMVISPDTLTWAAVSPGAINQTSNNDPTLINNTGNHNSLSGNVKITATNLLGERNSSRMIPIANFSVSTVTGGNAECVGGTTPVNATATGITNAALLRGNHSLNDGSTGQEQIYYCIKEVPSTISSQTYSTKAYGSWYISVA